MSWFFSAFSVFAIDVNTIQRENIISLGGIYINQRDAKLLLNIRFENSSHSRFIFRIFMKKKERKKQKATPNFFIGNPPQSQRLSATSYVYKKKNSSELIFRTQASEVHTLRAPPKTYPNKS